LLLVLDPKLQYSSSISLDLIYITSGDSEMLITLTTLCELLDSPSFPSP